MCTAWRAKRRPHSICRSRTPAGPDAPARPGARRSVSIGDAGCGRYALAVADVTRRSVARVVGRPPRRRRHPPHQQRRRHHQLRDDRDGPADARVRRRRGWPVSEIHVRRARPAEALTTLDGEARTLDETMLVIADRERAVAVAGVMGGATSEVSATTTRMAFESAWFLPATVRATGRKLGLKTEASARFERGADISAPVAGTRARTRPARGHRRGHARSARHLRRLPRAPIRARRRAASRASGRVLGHAGAGCARSRASSRALGFVLRRRARRAGRSRSRRSASTCSREIDLIEEVGRHWGFDRMPRDLPGAARCPRPSAPGVSAQPPAAPAALRRGSAGSGDVHLHRRAAGRAAYANDGRRSSITNPLSEKFAVLRPSTGRRSARVAGLQPQPAGRRCPPLRARVDFRARPRRTPRGRLGPDRLSATRTGAATGPHWLRRRQRRRGTWSPRPSASPIDVAPADDLPWFARASAAAVRVGGAAAGWVGQLSTASRRRSTRRLRAENSTSTSLGRAALAPVARDRVAAAAFPDRRARSLDCRRRTLASRDVRGTIRTSAPATLAAVREFDRYQGKGVPEGHVSLSLRLTFQHADRTLTDAEVQQAIDTIVDALGREHQARLRGR